MNKRKIFLGLFLTLCLNIFSLSINDIVKSNRQTIVYYGLNGIVPFRSVKFSANKTIEFCELVDSGENNIWNHPFNYELKKKDGFIFLTERGNANKEYLLLISDLYLVVYDASNSKMLFWGISVPKKREVIYNIKGISASSELAEGKKIYKAKNMENLKLDNPWVEGKKGYGVGEKIFLPMGNRSITLYSGYISAKNPCLWRQNSRPKTILITCKEKGFSKKIELKDTPNPQTIVFDELFLTSLEITILDIYKGTKYDDTCIHFIHGAELYESDLNNLN